MEEKVEVLLDVMIGLDSGYKFLKTKAYQMKNIKVIKEHNFFFEQDEFQKWPGKHKNVFVWVELENGFLVGCNENMKRGISYPCIKKSDSSSTSKVEEV